jgi:hypothetical protein
MSQHRGDSSITKLSLGHKINFYILILPPENNGEGGFVFSFISPFVLCFHSVSNFYFTSQYHQFPLSHAAAAAAAISTPQ